MLVLFWYLVDSHASKDDLRFLKKLRGVNEGSNGDKIIFKHYKHVGLIGNNMTIKMIGWQLQHRFHDEQKFYSSYGKAQVGATNTC